MTILNTKWVNCSKCGHRYADWVKACPRCNATNPKKFQSRIVTLAVVSVIGIVAFSLFAMGFFNIPTKAITSSEKPVVDTPITPPPLTEVPIAKSVPSPLLEDRHEFIAKTIHDYVNQAREEAGVKSLAWDDRTAQGAQAWADYMAENKLFDHNYKGNSAFCYENLVLGGAKYGDQTANDYGKNSVQAWLDSKAGHRENMLSPNHTKEGIGFAVDEDGIAYISERFDCGITQP